MQRRPTAAPAVPERASSGRWAGGDVDGVADADLSVVEDVGTEPAAVDERPQDGSCGVPLGDLAGFTQPHAAAAHVTDHEVAADEAVEPDAAGEDVAAVLIRPQRWLEGLAHLGFDQGDRAAWQTGGKVPPPGNQRRH